ncbi:MAG: hypothetical protein WD294_15370 [Phycisphaeraceae bacterium]
MKTASVITLVVLLSIGSCTGGVFWVWYSPVNAGPDTPEADVWFQDVAGFPRPDGVKNLRFFANRLARDPTYAFRFEVTDNDVVKAIVSQLNLEQYHGPIAEAQFGNAHTGLGECVWWEPTIADLRNADGSVIYRLPDEPGRHVRWVYHDPATGIAVLTQVNW